MMRPILSLLLTAIEAPSAWRLAVWRLASDKVAVYADHDVVEGATRR